VGPNDNGHSRLSLPFQRHSPTSSLDRHNTRAETLVISIGLPRWDGHVDLDTSRTEFGSRAREMFAVFINGAAR